MMPFITLFNCGNYICQQLLSAPKPGIGGNNALARSQHKDLPPQVLVFSFLYIPALVEIAAVCSGEVRRAIDYHRTLTLEKFIQLQVCRGVNRAAKQLRDRPPFQFLAVNQDIIFSEVPGNIPERRGRLGVHLKHQTGNIRRGGVRDHYFCADTLECGRFQLEAERGRTAHVKSALTPGVVGAGHTLLNGFTLQLGKHNTDIQHSPAHWRGGVKLFRRGNKLHTAPLEQSIMVAKSRIERLILSSL